MDNFIEFLYSKFLQSDGVSIDTRTIQPENLFFAIKGPNFEANQYAEKALEKGASFAVVDDEKYANDPRIIVSRDSMKALQDLATFHRSRYKRKLLAITGSNGKTTTKELVSRVLSKKYIVHATTGNYNNHLGVPLTLLHIHPQVEIAVIEMGANHVGEIAALCRIANPDFGLITNIGEAHTEGFGGIEGVLRGKSELFDHLRKADGKPFINRNDERLANMAKRFPDPVFFPPADLELISSNPYIRIRLGKLEIGTRLVGQYNFGNIAAAVVVGREFGVTDEAILDAVSTYAPSNQRSQVIEKGPLTIINDCYNANPSSMQAAIENLMQMKGRKIAILGDMKEVANNQSAHQALGRLIQKSELDKVYFLGPKMRHAHEEVQGSVWFEDLDELAALLKEERLTEGTVLIKGSRSMKLETLADQL